MSVKPKELWEQVQACAVHHMIGNWVTKAARCGQGKARPEGVPLEEVNCHACILWTLEHTNAYFPTHKFSLHKAKEWGLKVPNGKA